MAQDLSEVRGDLADLRHRIIYHAKRGRRAPKLRKAYQRLKAKAARLARIERRRKQKLWASKHFAFAEFNTHDGTPVPAAAKPAVATLCRTILEPMRAQYGACRVTSGYRHRAYNARIGGATNSYHIYDLRPKEPAADVSFAFGNPEKWAATARKLGAGGVGTYPRSGFVHIDLGPRRDWRQ